MSSIILNNVPFEVRGDKIINSVGPENNIIYLLLNKTYAFHVCNEESNPVYIGKKEFRETYVDGNIVPGDQKTVLHGLFFFKTKETPQTYYLHQAHPDYIYYGGTKIVVNSKFETHVTGTYDPRFYKIKINI